jgi:hypothetical protein
LAEGFEHVTPKLQHLVEKEHAVMREAHLSWSRRVAAPDEPGVGNRVVRRAKGAAPDECASRGQRPGDGVHCGDLQRLPLGERGQDAREAAREHRLPRSGRTGEQCVVSARCGNLERAFRCLLAGDVTHVIDILRDRQRDGRGRRTQDAPAELADELVKRKRSRQRDATHETGLGHVRRRHNERVLARCSREHGDGKRAANRAQRPVEAELPDRHDSIERAGRQLSRTHQDA